MAVSADPNTRTREGSSVSQPAATGGRANALDRQLMSGLAWQGALRWLGQALSWSVTIVVARMLSPDDFGVVSLAAAFAVLAPYVTEYSIGRSVVMDRITRRSDLERLHAICILVGLALSLAMAAAAPMIARVWSEPRVLGPLVAWSATFLLSGMLAIPSNRLLRAMRYRTVALVELVKSIVQSLIVLGLALAGARYWALVVGYVASYVVSVWVYYRLAWLSPSMPAVRELRPLLRYPRHLFAGNITWYAYSNADYLAVGRVLGTSALGVYQLAWNIAQLPGEKVMNVIQGVTGPFFGRIGRDAEMLRRYLLLILEAAALIHLPILAGIALVTDTAVPLIFGAKWEGAVAPMRLLLANAACLGIGTLLTQALNAAGEARVTSRLGLVLVILLPVSFVVAASSLGATAVAACWVLAQPLMLGFPALCLARKVGVPVWALLRAVSPAVLLSVVMMATVRSTHHLLGGGPSWGRLAIEVIVGVVTVLLMAFVAYRPRLKALLSVVRDARGQPLAAS